MFKLQSHSFAPLKIFFCTTQLIINNSVVTNDKLEWMWNEVVMDCLKVLFWYSSGRTEETHGKLG